MMARWFPPWRANMPRAAKPSCACAMPWRREFGQRERRYACEDSASDHNRRRCAWRRRRGGVLGQKRRARRRYWTFARGEQGSACGRTTADCRSSDQELDRGTTVLRGLRRPKTKQGQLPDRISHVVRRRAVSEPAISTLSMSRRERKRHGVAGIVTECGTRDARSASPAIWIEPARGAACRRLKPISSSTNVSKFVRPEVTIAKWRLFVGKGQAVSHQAPDVPLRADGGID